MIITTEEAEELRRLSQAYRDHSKRALEMLDLLHSDRTVDAALFQRLFDEHSKVEDAINGINKIYSGEGKTTAIPGSNKPFQIK